MFESRSWRCSIFELVASRYIYRGKRQSDEPHRDISVRSGRKIDENYFFLAFILSLILGFAVTVAIWLREVVFHFTTFWVKSLVAIYPGRASILDLHRIRYILHRIMYSSFATSNWHEIWRHYDIIIIVELMDKIQISWFFPSKRKLLK